MEDTRAFFRQRQGWAFFTVSVAIALGFFLTILSLVGVCTEACAEGHKYTLYGMQFETAGFIFFSLLALVHFLSKAIPVFEKVTPILLALGLGAELFFIFVQKFWIGAWCPICLSIAATVALAYSPFIFSYFQQIAKQKQKGGEMSHMFLKGFKSLSTIILGSLIAFSGIAKVNKLQATEDKVEKMLRFGEESSPVYVYIFSGWSCPACKKLEPSLEKMLPKVMKQAKVVFVDPETDPSAMNFFPYNLSFMIYEKDKYIELRAMINNIAKTTNEPNDEMVSKAAAALGVKYNELNFSEVTAGMKYFKNLIQEYNIRRIPAMVIVDSRTNEQKKLVGINEIVEPDVLKIIERLKSGQAPLYEDD